MLPATEGYVASRRHLQWGTDF